MVKAPGVLMVTGAYYPELSGAGLQCRALVRELDGRASFTVLTTATEPRLRACDEVDGVPVHRVLIDVARGLSKLGALFTITSTYWRLRHRFDIVHLHGFSQKSILLMRLARSSGKKVLIKLTSVSHDDPLSMQRKGGQTFRAFAAADAFVGVSPRFEQLYQDSDLPPGRFHLIPNGVDLARFRPAAADERRALRRELGLPDDLTLILFVGFFSHEKCPAALFDAWVRTLPQFAATGLVFVGATCSRYYEIDPRIATRIRTEAGRLGVDARVAFVERADDVEKFYRAADIFVLPSMREGLPNVVLEAMASGLPCVVSRLPGVTDIIIDDGRDGLLVAPGDPGALAEALVFLLRDSTRASALGAAARHSMARYALSHTAAQYLALYQGLLGN